MKLIQWILFSMAITLTASSCFIDIDDDDGFFGPCVNGSGPIITETIFLPNFDGIELRSSADIFLKQGPEFEVVVEGKENIIDELSREVDNGVWEIDFDRCVRDVDDFNIFITMPDLRKLRVLGSGDVFGENVFIIGDLEVDIPGSGNVDLALEADDLDVDIPGSGDLSLEGTADETKYRIPGSGDVRAFGLVARTADINIIGSGDVEVFVTEFMRVRISGSGDVFFRGEPDIDVAITGSGDLIDAN